RRHHRRDRACDAQAGLRPRRAAPARLRARRVQRACGSVRTLDPGRQSGNAVSRHPEAPRKGAPVPGRRGEDRLQSEGAVTDNVYAPPRASLETQEGPQELWRIDFKTLKRLYNASHSIRALGFLYGLGAFGIVTGAILALGPYSASGFGRGLAALM